MPGTFGEWLCCVLPWHRWRHVRWLSEQSRLSRCEHCGREWATNYDVRVTLPFHTVEYSYQPDKPSPSSAHL